MAKSLITIGIGKLSKLPPKFGNKPAEGDDINQQASEYRAAPPTTSVAPPARDAMMAHESAESPEPGDNDLKPGAQFSGSVAHYHDSTQRCDNCKAWNGNDCDIWTNATDPGGWCSVWPADYMKHEQAEAAGEGEIGPEAGEMEEAA